MCSNNELSLVYECFVFFIIYLNFKQKRRFSTCHFTKSHFFTSSLGSILPRYSEVSTKQTSVFFKTQTHIEETYSG